MQHRRTRLGVCALVLVAAVTVGRPAKALIIELPYVGPPVPAPVLAGLTLSASIAASTWESHFADDVILHFKIDSMPLPPGILGYFDVHPVTTGAFTYTDVAAALAADATSPADASAVAALQPGPALSMITNDTTAAPSLRMHVSTAETYNTTLRLTRANQKALGLLAGADGGLGADGAIVLNSAAFPMMDFDPSDGITPGFFDMTAILTHEIAHGMGFIGGVDHIDFASSDGGGTVGGGHPHDYSGETIFTVLDLYRYSAESMGFPTQPATGAVLDWAAGTSPIFGDNPYFSIDGGATSVALFSTGVEFGDGFQAQHWKDSSFLGSPIGLLDPDIGKGELGVVTALDVLGMDVIGWTLVPEPSSIVMAGIAFVFVVGLAWRRGSRRAQG